MVILKDIISNNVQQFNFRNYTFYCTPYGILTLDDLYTSNSVSKGCKKKIDELFIKRPDLKYFTNSKMHIEQMYSIELKEKKCVIYASGQKTLAELLLENGLAVVKPGFSDEEFHNYFKKAQRRGEHSNEGIYRDNTLRACIVEIYK